MKLLKRSKPKARIRQSGLIVLAALLVGSAGFRLVPLAEPAFALVDAATDKDMTKTDAPMAETRDMGDILQRLLAREQAVEAREAELIDREIALQIAEEAITSKLDELVAAEEQLSATIARADVAFEDDVTNLTQIFGEMKPKQAAALFGEMEPEFAAGFLARMAPEESAGILAAMEPRTAYSVSVVMAGRNANVPTD